MINVYIKKVEESNNKIAGWIFNHMMPFFRDQKYLEKLSTSKLIKVAERTLAYHPPLYSTSEAVYEEMIARLKKMAESESLIAKIMKENDKIREDKP